jgi:hypothetical protein
MKRVSVLCTFIFVFSQFILISSGEAVEPLRPILSCLTNPEQACIQQINVVTAEGKIHKSTLSTKRISEVRTYAAASVLNANWQLYDVAEISINGKNLGGQFLIRPFYFPLGNSDCFYTPCVEGSQYLEFALNPIERDGISTLADLGYKYEIFFSVPESFLLTSSNGRGVRTIELSRSNVFPIVTGYKNYRLLAEPIAYSEFPREEWLNGILIEKASRESDQAAIWFWGSEDKKMKTYGQCKNLESMSVTGNIFWLGAPSWNPSTKSIEVWARAPHLKSDGTLNQGYFQAKVSTAMARCLWNVDLSKSVEAKISLTYDEGKKVQVETWNGNLVGDEYVLTVSGIHFSSPTLAIKLEQKPNLDVSPTPILIETEEVKANVVKPILKNPARKISKTITCTKGKTTKKITGLAPKCPAGYKKK